MFFTLVINQSNQIRAKLVVQSVHLLRSVFFCYSFYLYKSSKSTETFGYREIHLKTGG